MSSKKFIRTACAAVTGLVIAVGIACLCASNQAVDDIHSPGKTTSGKHVLHPRPRVTQRDPKAAVQQTVANRKIPRMRMGEKPGFEEFLDGLSKKEQSLVLSVQNALDEENFAAVTRAAHAALAASNPEVREVAVEALGWFGAEALPELTPLMADPDEAVAETAMAQWELALGEIDESETRAAIAEAVMQTLRRKDALESIICEITNQDDDLAILESLVSIIEGENPIGAEVAREAYETLTGEAWSDIDAANNWLEANYDPPEPGEEDS